MKQLKKIWNAELRRRRSWIENCERIDRNWPIHKELCLREFHSFAELARKDSVNFRVVDYAENQAADSNGPWTIGQDSITLSCPNRWAAQETHYESLGGWYRSPTSEIGASLVIHFTEGQGLIHVFFEPPVLTNTIQERSSILRWYSHNTDHLTTDFVRSLMRDFLTYNRVESHLLKSGLSDRLKVRWWRFKDARNRKNLFGKTVGFLNAWELAVLAAALGVVNFVLSLIK